MGPKAVLLALPGPTCDEVCQLLREAADHVRDSTAEYRSQILKLSETQIGALAPAKLEEKILRAVWGMSSQKLSEDMATLLRHFWSHQEAELPDPVRGNLHKVLRYLIENKSWETASFLLRTGLESGVKTSVCGSVLTQADMHPESLQAMAERLWHVFGTDEPGEG
ncbi:unnamed protein product [Ostreobium quekettii]|uniref:Uncharacterized protein n=1 Tax=Ostreobium quekettii TaxID=121088 RepID=A0A8S1J7B1_9CHLO|nr:unnamed protein product [Ostreobium quekettii]|eukprot:evm.model.scf_521.7 EVM.evm.TU.scf_521.7   scf_521:64656-65595(-)